MIKRIVAPAIRIQHNFDGFWIGESRQNFRAEITLGLILARAFTEPFDLSCDRLVPSITGIPAKDGVGVVMLTKIAITTLVTDNFSVFNAF